MDPDLTPKAKKWLGEDSGRRKSYDAPKSAFREFDWGRLSEMNSSRNETTANYVLSALMNYARRMFPRLIEDRKITCGVNDLQALLFYESLTIDRVNHRRGVVFEEGRGEKRPARFGLKSLALLEQYLVEKRLIFPCSCEVYAA